MNRPWMAVVAVSALAVVAGAVVVLALRPASVPPPPPLQLDSGAVALAGDTVVRWVGPSGCNAEADAVPLERSVDGGEWEASDIPLANVYDLSFADEQHGVATGTTSTCSRGVATTSDGGRTWVVSPQDPVLLDGWFVDDVVWGVEQVIGTPRVAAFADDGDALSRVGQPSRPCSASDGSPDHVAFWTPDRGLLLCQGTVSSDLLVARTVNGGESFEALADDRPELGLASTAVVADMVVAGERSVWMLFEPGGDCLEGELRYSDSEGASFEALACPSEYVDIDDVLDVAFSSDTEGVMLARLDRAPVMATTSDGGATWVARL